MLSFMLRLLFRNCRSLLQYWHPYALYYTEMCFWLSEKLILNREQSDKNYKNLTTDLQSSRNAKSPSKEDELNATDCEHTVVSQTGDSTFY